MQNGLVTVDNQRVSRIVPALKTDYGISPATGFSADLKTLLSVVAPAETVRRSGILAPWLADEGLMSRVRTLRAAGERVIYGLPGQPGTPADLACDRILVSSGDGWEVQLAGDSSE